MRGTQFEVSGEMSGLQLYTHRYTHSADWRGTSGMLNHRRRRRRAYYGSAGFGSGSGSRLHDVSGAILFAKTLSRQTARLRIDLLNGSWFVRCSHLSRSVFTSDRLHLVSVVVHAAARRNWHPAGHPPGHPIVRRWPSIRQHIYQTNVHRIGQFVPLISRFLRALHFLPP